MAKAVIRKAEEEGLPVLYEKATGVDYKDTALLRKFISDRGKIRARRVTGNCVQHQRDVAMAVRTPARSHPCLHVHRPLERGLSMKLIPTQEVTGLGAPGDVVEVRTATAATTCPAWPRAARWTRVREPIKADRRLACGPRPRPRRADQDQNSGPAGEREGARRLRGCLSALSRSAIAGVLADVRASRSTAHDRGHQPDQVPRRPRGVGLLSTPASATPSPST